MMSDNAARSTERLEQLKVGDRVELPDAQNWWVSHTVERIDKRHGEDASYTRVYVTERLFAVPTCCLIDDSALAPIGHVWRRVQV